MKFLDEELLRELFIKRQLTKDEICKQLNTSLDTLNKNLEHYNLTRDLGKFRSNAAIKSREANFQSVFESLDIEGFLHYYNDVSNVFENLQEKFNLSARHLNRVLKELGLEKITQEQMNALNALKSSISYDSLYEYYIVENHSCNDTQKHFNITYSQLNKLLHEYNIVKDHRSRNSIARVTKENLYGSATYNNREKAKNTCLKIYGVDNIFKDKEKMRNAYKEKLGVDHPMKLDSVKERMIQNTDYVSLISKTHATNLQRYGVENAACLSDVKAKIRTSLQNTFLEKYGSTCYWTSADCKVSYSTIHSAPNESFAKLLESRNVTYEREFKLVNRSYDFRISTNLVEINPSATHNSTWGIFSTQGLDKYYHKDKSQLAENNGYRCIHVWDWDDKDRIVKLLLPRKRIFARKCEVRDVDLSTTREYLNTYHLQGYARDSIRVGLYYNDELVSIMTFGKPRYNKKCEYELIRYCSSYDVVGGAEKLFTHFIRTYNPTTVVSYCDKSKFTGKTYLNLGFKFESNNVSKHWYNPITNVHVTDNFLRQRGFDQIFNTDYGKGTSNDVLMLEAGFIEIFDAGQSTYIWFKGD